jgi:hypothetical protein
MTCSQYRHKHKHSLSLLLTCPRRLTEQTLDACQTKRQRSDQVAVELRYVCRHLQAWQLLGKELTLQVGGH